MPEKQVEAGEVDKTEKVFDVAFPSGNKTVDQSTSRMTPMTSSPVYKTGIGVRTIVEPGGSIRNSEVQEAARELNIELVETGLRLFHH
jgi:hypothetical protein